MQVLNQFWITSIIFLASLGLHLSLISKGPVTLDCLSLAINSQATLETHHLHYLFGSGYPLMVLLGSLFIFIGKAVGITDPVLAVNFISVFFSSIAILAFYLLVQRICDTLTAILASLLLLLNPIFLDVSTYGINHAPALCFFLLGALSLLRFQTLGKIPNLLLSALFFGLMGATRLQDFILTFPAVTFMFIFGLQEHSSQNNNHKVRCFLIFFTAIILVIILFHLPYFIFDYTHYAIQAKNNWQSSLNSSFQGLFSPLLRITLLIFNKGFSIAGIVCFGAGLFYTAKFNKKILIFTVLWLIVPLSLFSNIITIAPRFFNIIIPALIIPISIALAHMFRYKKVLWRLSALIVFLIIILLPLFNPYQAILRRHYTSLIPDYYHWVGKSTEPDAKFLCIDEDLFITYYSKRNILKKPVIDGQEPPNTLINFKRKLDYILNDQIPVYITGLGLTTYDRNQEFLKFLRQNYRLINVGEKPLETWYRTPFMPGPFMCSLVKIERRI